MRNSKNIVFGMLALVVSVVAIGLAYAGFTGTLNINGTGNVISSKWDIYFNNLSNAVTTGTANVVTPATISPKTKIGDYYVELASPGDSVTYTFDVVNDGDFDAVLTTLTKSSPTCSGGATLCNYLSYTLKYTSNNTDVAENDKLLVGETKNMTLKLILDPNMPASALSSTELSVSDLGITLLYSQDSSYGGNPVTSAVTFVNRQNEGQITAGDEIAIDSEHFYVVSSDASETVLLAKYNLLVGDVYEQVSGTWTKTNTLTSSDTGYGLQNETAKGYNSADSTHRIGVVAFSGKGYWDNANCVSNGSGSSNCPGTAGLKSEYANASNPAGTTSYTQPYPYVYRSSMSSTAPSYTYGSPWGYAQDNGYTIAYYVEEYVNKLKELGAPEEIEGKLLTYEQASSLSSAMRGTWSYWLGSAGNLGSVALVRGGSVYNNYNFWSGSYFGVRPVIIVSTSDL